LERADVIIYDYLANPRLLDFARPDSERILVGKHGGGSRVEQDVIEDLLIEHARQGKLVVRLKGGDPFIFGRGGEEATAAAAAGIDFEIVPGITSAIAAPAYAGIPLTHRDWASNVIFTTGYEYPNKPALAVRWEELARRGSTLVILMTQRQLRENMDKLRVAGRDADTPVAVIEWGTLTSQRTIVGTIRTVADLADREQVQPPALAVVGDVVRLHDQLRWHERKPLFGKHIVVTRPKAQASVLGDLLEDAGADVIYVPTIAIVPPDSNAPLDAALQRPEEFDWVLFTSINGVNAFFDRLRVLQIDLRRWHRARIGAIGTQTANVLQQKGLLVDVIPGDFKAEGLIDALVARGIKGQRILLPRAARARAILPEQLRAHGATVEEVESYQSVPAQSGTYGVHDLLTSGGADLITFTSSSTVHNFITLFRKSLPDILERVEIACIGPITSATAREYGMTIAIEPARFTIPDLFDAIVRHYTT